MSEFFGRIRNDIHWNFILKNSDSFSPKVGKVSFFEDLKKKQNNCGEISEKFSPSSKIIFQFATLSFSRMQLIV